MTAFLVVLFWLKGVLDDGKLVMIADGTFDRAVSALLPQLESHDDLWKAMEKSAVKNARRIGARLEQDGYYT